MDWRLVYGSTRPLCVGEMRKDWFDAALEVLKVEGSDQWSLWLKGA